MCVSVPPPPLCRGLITSRMNPLLPVTFVLVALCSLASVDSSAYDKIVSHSRIRARKEG